MKIGRGGQLRRLGLVSALVVVAALAVASATAARADVAGPAAAPVFRLLEEYPKVVFIDGAANKTCDELDVYGAPGASWTELKFDSGDLPTVGNAATKSDSFVSVTLTRTDTDTWSWTSTKGIDAVFVKSGASGSFLYVYDPPLEATSGSGLTVPGQNGTSHIAFCYDEGTTPPPLQDLTVAKTGAGTYDVQHSWSVDKQVKEKGAADGTYGDNLVLAGVPDGESRTVTWRVVVTHEGETETNFAVSGTITVSNPNATGVTGVSVTDTLAGAVVDCSPDSGVQNTGLTVPANGSLTCGYTAAPGSKVTTNTATAAWDGKSASGSVAVAWQKGADLGVPASVNDDGQIDEEVDLGDLAGGTWTTTYDETWACKNASPSPNAGRTNTATVTWSGGSDADSASVQVGCGSTPPPPPPPPPPPSPPQTVKTDEFMDVQVIKNATPQVQLVNGQADVAYTVRVRNNGPNQAHDVQLVDSAPSGVTFTGITQAPVGGGCSLSGGVLLQCSLGTLGPGVERVIGLSARVTQTGTYVNCATGTGSGKDTNGANNRACASTLVTAPVTPPTTTPKPPVKPKPKPKPLNICRVLKVTPSMIKANGARQIVVAKVTRSRNPVAGVAVRFAGTGLAKVVETNKQGIARFSLTPSKAGIMLVKITSAKACNSARIGVVGVFEPPVTG